MSTFAVFGMTRTMALTEARKKVYPYKGHGKDRVHLSPEEWEQECQRYADRVMEGARTTRLTQAFDAPQFAKEYVERLKKAGSCRDLSIKALAPVTIRGVEVRSTKTGKVKIAWQDWDTQSDRIRIGA